MANLSLLHHTTLCLLIVEESFRAEDAGEAGQIGITFWRTGCAFVPIPDRSIAWTFLAPSVDELGSGIWTSAIFKLLTVDLWALAFLADLGPCIPNLRSITLDTVSCSIKQRLSVRTVALE